MTGKNHIITNTCTVTSIGCGVAALHTGAINAQAYNTTSHSVLQSIMIGLDGIIWPVVQTMFFETDSLSFWLFAIISIAGFYIGTLMPDIDNPNSMLGKFLHLPIEHRTWTHAIWLPIILSLLAIMQRWLSWLVLGYMLHLIWDNFSRGGVCFLYPIKKYRHFGDSGAKIKDGHFLYLYRTGQMSEGIVVGVVGIVTILILILSIIYGAFHSIVFVS